MTIYTVLFCGLPLLGVAVYIALCCKMWRSFPSPPYFSLFFVFAAYGAVLLFAVSTACREWSGMHSAAAVGLVFVGTPRLIVQSVIQSRTWHRSVYDRFVVISGLCFPIALVILVLFTVIMD